MYGLHFENLRTRPLQKRGSGEVSKRVSVSRNRIDRPRETKVKIKKAEKVPKIVFEIETFVKKKTNTIYDGNKTNAKRGRPLFIHKRGLKNRKFLLKRLLIFGFYIINHNFFFINGLFNSYISDQNIIILRVMRSN